MDLKKEYAIHPLYGLDRVTFGMTRAEIVAHFGTPDQWSKNFVGEHIDTCETVTVTYAKDSHGEVEIGFSRLLKGVHLNNLHLLTDNSRNLINRLLSRASECYEGNGFLCFSQGRDKSFWFSSP